MYSKFFLAVQSVLLLCLSVVLAQSSGTALTNIDRTGWNATSTSADANQPAANAIDGSPSSYWQSSSGTSYPHNFTIDMRNSYLVNGLSYLPRSTGRIGRHTIEVSTNGTTWTLVSFGSWANTADLKTSSFAARTARYIRLVAQSGAAGGSLASAADINVLTNPKSTLSRENWRVSADSSEPGPRYYAPEDAIDGAPTSFWKTQAGSALPHTFTIDQGASIAVSGLTYLPQPRDLGTYGNIGQYRVERSTDGSTWTAVVEGTWQDNTLLKTAEFAAVSARYFRLVALTESSGRPIVSAAEINLLDGSSQLGSFTVTVSSQETATGNFTGIRALDGTNATFWQSRTSVSPAAYPHYITVDMRRPLAVHSLTYVPRQDGRGEGNIGDHEVHVSSDGSTWRRVATGEFLDSSLPKLIALPESTARYVRLTALSEVGNRVPYVAVSEIQLGIDSAAVLPPASMGQWGETIDFPTVPVAASMIGDTGRVVIWSAFNAVNFVFSPGGQTVTATYDPSTGAVSQETVTVTQHDMFCPGISLDFAGRVWVTGGNDAERTSILDPRTGWRPAPDMRIPRGYQSQVTLSDGRLWTLGGSWSGNLFDPKNGEVFTQNTTSGGGEGSWSLIPGNPVGPILTADREGAYRSDNHGWFFPWTNGTVFHAGPSRAMNWFSTANGGGVLGAGNRASDGDSMCGIAAMYDAVRGRILTAGGSPSYTESAASRNVHRVTIGAPNGTVNVEALAPMTYPRAFHNGVVLPDGKVLVVGGQEYAMVFTDDQPVLHPELFDPATGRWTVLAPEPTPRTYHSVALLLGDGTVLSGGGGLCWMCTVNHFDAQIFRPPYLFNSDGSAAVRPVITAVSNRSVAVGGQLTATTNGAVTGWSLIRTSSVTHTVNTDQRRVPLEATVVGTNMYRFTLPSDPGVLLPGYWMLFALNSQGTPSVAQYILVNPAPAPAPAPALGGGGGRTVNISIPGLELGV